MDRRFQSVQSYESIKLNFEHETVGRTCVNDVGVASKLQHKEHSTLMLQRVGGKKSQFPVAQLKRESKNRKGAAVCLTNQSAGGRGAHFISGALANRIFISAFSIDEEFSDHKLWDFPGSRLSLTSIISTVSTVIYLELF